MFLFVLVLAIAMVITLVACDKDKKTEDDPVVDPTPAVTLEQTDVDKAISALKTAVQSYLDNNAINSNDAVACAKDLSEDIAKQTKNCDSATISKRITKGANKGTYKFNGAFTVTKGTDGKTYTVNATFTNKDLGSYTGSFTVEAKFVDYGIWAGESKLETLAVDAASTGAADTFTNIINSVIDVINSAYANGKLVAQGNKLGFSVLGYVEANFGSVEPGDTINRYEIEIKGEAGKTSAQSTVAFEVREAGKTPVFAIYYKDANLYIKAGETKFFLSDTDIPEIVTNIVDLVVGNANGNIANGEDVLLDPINSFSELFAGIMGDNAAMVDQFIPILFAYANEEGKNQVELNLGSIISSLSSLGSVVDSFVEGYADLIDGIGTILQGGAYSGELFSFDGAQIYQYMNQFNVPTEWLYNVGDFVKDAAGMKFAELSGIAGSLMITTNEDANGTDVEISLNIPKSLFKFSNADDGREYGPINLALGFQDVKFDDEMAVTLPALTDYEEVYPLNVYLTASLDIYSGALEADTYDVALFTDINIFSVAEYALKFARTGNWDDFAKMNAKVCVEIFKNEGATAWLQGEFDVGTLSFNWNKGGKSYTLDAKQFVEDFDIAELQDNKVAAIAGAIMSKIMEMMAEKEPQQQVDAAEDEALDIAGESEEIDANKIIELVKYIIDNKDNYYSYSTYGEEWYEFEGVIGADATAIAELLQMIGLDNTYGIYFNAVKTQEQASISFGWKYPVEEGYDAYDVSVIGNWSIEGVLFNITGEVTKNEEVIALVTAEATTTSVVISGNINNDYVTFEFTADWADWDDEGLVIEGEVVVNGEKVFDLALTITKTSIVGTANCLGYSVVANADWSDLANIGATLTVKDPQQLSLANVTFEMDLVAGELEANVTVLNVVVDIEARWDEEIGFNIMVQVEKDKKFLFGALISIGESYFNVSIYLTEQGDDPQIYVYMSYEDGVFTIGYEQSIKENIYSKVELQFYKGEDGCYYMTDEVNNKDKYYIQIIANSEQFGIVGGQMTYGTREKLNAYGAAVNFDGFGGQWNGDFYNFTFGEKTEITFADLVELIESLDSNKYVNSIYNSLCQPK